MTTEPTTILKPRRRWFRFGLSTLMWLAFGCGFVLHHGYLTHEDQDFTTGCDWVIPTPEGVSHIDVGLELLRRATERNVQHGFSIADIELDDCYVGGIRYTRVHVNKWCRRRFQVWNWRYVRDYRDEVARARNVAMERAIASLSDHWSEALDVVAEKCIHLDE